MMILLLDKQPQRLQQTAETLKRMYPKYIVATHDDPLAAVQYVYYNPVDVVITALDMRPMNGVQYIEAARKVNGKAKMILMASESELNEYMVFDDEADGFWMDPFDEQELVSLLSGRPKQIAL